MLVVVDYFYFSFYLATLEAALEHVTNEQLTYASATEELTGVNLLLMYNLSNDSCSKEKCFFFAVN